MVALETLPRIPEVSGIPEVPRIPEVARTTKVLAIAALASFALSGAPRAQFDAYDWELKSGSYGAGQTTVLEDRLDVLLDPLCSLGYADNGWARTSAPETGRFGFDWVATSQACPTGFGQICSQAHVFAQTGACDCPFPLFAGASCQGQLAFFNGGQLYTSGTYQESGHWEVDVVAGDCLRIGAMTANLTLDCQILAHFRNLEFTAALETSSASLSLAAGGTETLLLTGPAALAGELYLVLGSASGTSPGLPLDGHVLPLVPDGYFLYTLSNPGAPPLGSALGLLDGNGLASASFSLPPGASPSLAGATLHHAFLVVELASSTVAFVSNARSLELVP